MLNKPEELPTGLDANKIDQCIQMSLNQYTETVKDQIFINLLMNKFKSMNYEDLKGAFRATSDFFELFETIYPDKAEIILDAVKEREKKEKENG